MYEPPQGMKQRMNATDEKDGQPSNGTDSGHNTHFQLPPSEQEHYDNLIPRPWHTNAPERASQAPKTHQDLLPRPIPSDHPGEDAADCLALVPPIERCLSASFLPLKQNSASSGCRSYAGTLADGLFADPVYSRKIPNSTGPHQVHLLLLWHALSMKVAATRIRSVLHADFIWRGA